MRNKILNLFGDALLLFGALVSATAATAQTPDARVVFNTQTTSSGTRKNPIYIPPQIYAMHADGSGVVALTDYAGGAVSPAWSPNQQYVSFMGSGGLMVMEAIGQANGGRTFVAATDVQNTGMDWSPDGTRICYSGYTTQGLWIVTINPVTQEVGTPVQVATGWCGYPSWAPDGKRIAFTFKPDGLPWGNQFIKVTDLETGAETPFNTISSAHPEWSPDGTKIAFDATVRITTTKGSKTTTNSYVEVFIANADGGGVTQVTHVNNVTGLAAWSPDGKNLALVSDISGTRSIYKFDPGTGGMTLLHEGESPDWNP